MKPEEALKTIKGIELTHVEHYEDEDADGEWTYCDLEESDGTIEENHPEEAKTLEEALKVLRILKKHARKISEFPGQEKNPDIQITVMPEADEDYETVRNWLEASE